MPAEIREMVVSDYESVYDIWRTTEGICLSDDDDRDRISLYLARNRRLCFVATLNGMIVGTVLSGHDGRRGILRHLVVLPGQRGLGIGRLLVRTALDALSAQGIKRCNIFVMDDNPSGMKYWEHIGFHRLEENYRTLQSLTIPAHRRPPEDKYNI